MEQHQESRANLISTILPPSLYLVCLRKFDVYFQDDGKNEIHRQSQERHISVWGKTVLCNIGAKGRGRIVSVISLEMEFEGADLRVL